MSLTPLSAEVAKLWCERLVAVALLQQTLEFLSLREAFSASGVWPWSIVKDEYPTLLRGPLTYLFSYRGMLVLLSLQLIAALMLMFFPGAVIVAMFTASLIAIRFRGSFNGGSDYMTLLLLAALSVAELRPDFTQASLYYIGVQTVLSYFVAGMSKIIQSGWRSGDLLRDFVCSSPYNAPDFVKTLFSRAGNGARLAMAWSILLFECLFPLALLDRRICVGFLLAGCFFHLLNAYVLGLNRFLLAWLAAYPAVYQMAMRS